MNLNLNGRSNRSSAAASAHRSRVSNPHSLAQGPDCQEPLSQTLKRGRFCPASGLEGLPGAGAAGTGPVGYRRRPRTLVAVVEPLSRGGSCGEFGPFRQVLRAAEGPGLVPVRIRPRTLNPPKKRSLCPFSCADMLPPWRFCLGWRWAEHVGVKPLCGSSCLPLHEDTFWLLHPLPNSFPPRTSALRSRAFIPRETGRDAARFLRPCWGHLPDPSVDIGLKTPSCFISLMAA